MKFYRSFLIEQLADRKKKNSRYSLRAFAKMLGISPGQVSRVMSGKSDMTIKQVFKIIERLNPEENEVDQLLQSVSPSLSLRKDNPPFPKTTLIEEDEFKLISDWWHFAILSLSRFKQNRAEAKWIAEQLEIEPEQALVALKRLVRLNLISVREGKMSRTSGPLTTTKDIPSEAIRQYHRQNLTLASEKMEQFLPDWKEYSTITTAIDIKKIKKAKKMIVDFTEKLSTELSSDNPNEVYNLSVQLFPLTHNTMEKIK